MFKKPWIWLLLIVGIGFILRLIAYGFIKLPWIVYDEFTYLDTARQIVRGHFVSAFTRDQLYPAGWPLFLAAFTGFISNPIVQYKAALIVTMIFSSLVPIIAYGISGNLLVALLVSLYPPLFVYSSNILSETAYTLFLAISLLLLRVMIAEDFAKRSLAVFSGVLFGFMLYYISFTRSFGIVHIPSLILTAIVFISLVKKHAHKELLKKIGLFVGVAVIVYIICGFGAKWLALSPGKLYERTPYITIFQILFFKPLLFITMVLNELVIIGASTYWVLPFFFLRSAVVDFQQKKWPSLFTRLFLICVLIASVALTLAHMGKTVQNNPQYLLFSRYIDPALVVFVIYALADMIAWVKGKLQIKDYYHWYLIPIFLLLYARFGFYQGQYKFGNNMPVYFLSLLTSNQLYFPLLLLVVCALIWFLHRGRRLLFFGVFLLFFTVQSYISISYTRDVPAYVESIHQKIITEWQQALSQAGPQTPICLQPNALWGETFYMYSFLYPYQYLVDCNPARQNNPKWVIISATSAETTIRGCGFNYSFGSSGGDSLFYCPLGIK